MSPLTGTVTGSNAGLAAPQGTQRGHVWIGSQDPVIGVLARLRGPATSPLPRPRRELVARHGQASLTEYRGRDPYEMTIPVIFDGYRTGASIEADIAILERLVLPARGQVVPPIVKVTGPVPRHGLEWEIADLTEVAGRTEFDPGGARTRVAIDVTLVEHVADTRLTETLRASSSPARGVSHGRTRVRNGENSVYDVSRRVYGTPGRARDIAAANDFPVSRTLKTGRLLKLP